MSTCYHQLYLLTVVCNLSIKHRTNSSLCALDFHFVKMETKLLLWQFIVIALNVVGNVRSGNKIKVQNSWQSKIELNEKIPLLLFGQNLCVYLKLTSNFWFQMNLTLHSLASAAALEFYNWEIVRNFEPKYCSFLINFQLTLSMTRQL